VQRRIDALSTPQAINAASTQARSQRAAIVFAALHIA
jgi:hypothetical protein